jgi:hypothetical protein
LDSETLDSETCWSLSAVVCSAIIVVVTPMAAAAGLGGE